MKFRKDILLKRNRKKIKIRSKIKELNVNRLTVYKSLKHIYVQLFNFDGSKVILSSSSLDKDIRELLKDKKYNKTELSILVGESIAEKIIVKKISKIAFDRSGFKFHGRIKAIADVLRNKGIKI